MNPGKESCHPSCVSLCTAAYLLMRTHSLDEAVIRPPTVPTNKRRFHLLAHSFSASTTHLQYGIWPCTRNICTPRGAPAMPTQLSERPAANSECLVTYKHLKHTTSHAPSRIQDMQTSSTSTNGICYTDTGCERTSEKSFCG